MRATEAQCQATLIEAARRGGWLVHAERTSLQRSGRYSTAIQGDAGWPDLALCHRTRGFLLVELKRKPGKLSDGQVRWGMFLESAGVSWQTWWVPEELDMRAAWLISERA